MTYLIVTRRRVFPILVVIMLSGHLEVCADDLTRDILGSWRCSAAEAEGKGDGKEEGDTWTFSRNTFSVVSSRGKDKCKYRIRVSDDPPSIDWDCTDEYGNEWIGRGIVKCDGRNLQICSRLGLKGEQVARPTSFSTKTSERDPYLRMILFTRNEGQLLP